MHFKNIDPNIIFEAKLQKLCYNNLYIINVCLWQTLISKILKYKYIKTT